MSAKLYIDLERLVANIKLLAELVPNSKVIPVLKADAFGHGAVPLALYLKKLNLSYIAFANTKEAQQVKNAGYDLPILVLGANDVGEVLEGIKSGFTMSIASFEALRALSSSAVSGKIKVHLKFDTGMNRAGIKDSAASEFFTELKSVMAALPGLECEALYSHMACADEQTNSFNHQQAEAILAIAKLYRDKFGSDIKVHLQNSAGIINFPHYEFDWVRPGLAIYGINPSLTVELGLKPVLSWQAPIINVNHLLADETVSYNRTWRAKTKTNTATVQVGYGNGLDIRGSNGIFSAIIGGRLCPVVGKICMDMTVFDLGARTAKVGDMAILVGESGGLKIGAENLATQAGSIPYSVLTALTARNQRVYSDC